MMPVTPNLTLGRPARATWARASAAKGPCRRAFGGLVPKPGAGGRRGGSVRGGAAAGGGLRVSQRGAAISDPLASSSAAAGLGFSAAPGARAPHSPTTSIPQGAPFHPRCGQPGKCGWDSHTDVTFYSCRFKTLGPCQATKY